jgi:hypothetical protein
VKNGSGALAPVHLSKSIVGRWRTCRLAYRFERVDRLPASVSPSEGQVRGVAAHEAAALLLKGRIDPGSGEASSVIDRVVEKHCLTGADGGRLRDWVMDAVGVVLDRGGALRWIEELFSVERTSEFTLWAKFDVAIVGGATAPLEVLDLTFGRPRVADADELAETIGARAYRLAAGHAEPDRTIRPIAVTELHAPSRSTITIVPDDNFVREAWTEMKVLASEIRIARESDDFPATPGLHCRWCAYRDCCPVVTSAIDEPPA